MIYSENGIKFNNVKPVGAYIGTNGPLTAKSKYNTNEETGEIIHRSGDYIINGIDIHWNEAELKNINDENLPSTVTTTAELLVLLDNAYKKITALSNLVANLQEQLNTDLTDLSDKYNELETSLATFADNVTE